MSELEQPITRGELVQLLAGVLIETVAAVSTAPAIADERLEDMAGSFLDMATALMGNPGLAALFQRLAEVLIKTEHGG